MVQPKTKLMTVEIEKWMDDALEKKQKRSGVSKRFQVNEALEAYIGKKPSVADQS
jgi:hypothetical protein